MRGEKRMEKKKMRGYITAKEALTMFEISPNQLILAVKYGIVDEQHPIKDEKRVWRVGAQRLNSNLEFIKLLPKRSVDDVSESLLKAVFDVGKALREIKEMMG
jgi:hypothetical protein